MTIRFLHPLYLYLCLAVLPLLSPHACANLPAAHAPYGAAQQVSLPLAFEPNAGQCDAAYDYICRGPGYLLGLAPSGATLVLRGPRAAAPGGRAAIGQRAAAPARPDATLRIELIGANASAPASPGCRLPGTSNYLLGDDPAAWRTNLPNHESVEFRGVYPDTSVVYYGNDRQLEYDFRIGPGADPSRIRMKVSGAGALRLDTAGDLVAECDGALVRLKAPVAYQEIGGRRTDVACRYGLDGGNVVALQVGSYDRRHPLVVDPVVSYASFLGGTGVDEAFDVAVDASGYVYVTGVASAGFPVSTTAYDRTHNGSTDVFVIKLDVSQSGTASRVYATFIGGGGADAGNGIAVDSTGSAYVCGHTASIGFPKTYQPVLGTGVDAFLLKLNASGTGLSYSARLGGNGDDYGSAVAIDGSNRAYMTGLTHSTDYPTADAKQAVYAGSGDAFVSKLGVNGAALVYSTYLGGASLDQGLDIVADFDGRTVVTGATASILFPVTDGVYQPFFRGGATDAFVTKFNLAGDNHVFSTLLGGTIPSSGGHAADAGVGIARDAADNLYLTGHTSSVDFPTRNAYDNTFNDGEFDAFVAKMKYDGTSLIYSSFFGGNGDDYGYGMEVDAQGNMYFCGESGSGNLPVRNAFDNSATGTSDGFAAKFDSVGEVLVYSTFIGGSLADAAYGIAVGPGGRTYLAGTTRGTGFPATSTALQTSSGGGTSDAFVACLAPAASMMRDDTFATSNEQPGGSATGWSRIGQSDPTLVQMDYDLAQGAYRVRVFSDANRYRLGGWISNRSEWVPYSSIGTGKFVRAKFYMFASDQAQTNAIPNFRLRVANRFATSAYLEVYHHGDSTVESLSQELRPSTDPAKPSLYRVDYDPVDVPFLSTSTTDEGVCAGYDVFVLQPQDAGYIAMTECAIGTYPAAMVSNDMATIKVYEPSAIDAGTLKIYNSSTDIQKFNWMVPPGPEGTYAVVDGASEQPTYQEGTFGVTLDTSMVPSDRIGAIQREFFPGSNQALRARVDKGQQYKIRYHVTSARQTLENAQLVLRSRAIRYAWVNRLEIGGAWPSNNPSNYTIAQQTLPGIGCGNPDRDDAEDGGWYTLLVHTPMSLDIRPDVTGQLAARMPNICAQPGFGQNTASHRDLRVAADTYDTLSTGNSRATEAANFTIDRIEVRIHPLVDD